MTPALASAFTSAPPLTPSRAATFAFLCADLFSGLDEMIATGRLSAAACAEFHEIDRLVGRGDEAETLETLVAVLTDLVGRRVLSPASIPDDYGWLVLTLREIVSVMSDVHPADPFWGRFARAA